MAATHVSQVPASRLRAELAALGLQSEGSRSELVSRLQQAGVYVVYMNLDPPVPMIDTSKRNPDHSNVYIGNGAGLENTTSNQLFISNSARHTPLIHGDFAKGIVKIGDMLRLESVDFDADTNGEEGDIRRMGADLFMYRSEGVTPGWYPVLFGPVRIV